MCVCQCFEHFYNTCMTILETEEDDDDESTEELFSQPSTSKSTVNNIVPHKSKSKERKTPSFDDVDISTDFKSILDTANEK